MIRILTAGESHGKALVSIVEGFPSNLPISSEYIDFHLKRRQGGYGRSARMKIESDSVTNIKRDSIRKNSRFTNFIFD